jgi:membrane protein DedA with SNARE-associated domain
MFHWLVDAVGSSPWAYVLVAAVVAGDAIAPVLPGEAVVITGGVLAANHELAGALVVLVTFAGALAGDNAMYGLGRLAGPCAARKLFRSEKSRRRLVWAERQLALRGRAIIVIARFLPGGRTATTFASGGLGMAWARFIRADAIACALWAVYSTSLGYFGGSAFADNLWKPLSLSILVGLVLVGCAELYRRVVLDRRRPRGAQRRWSLGG